MDNEKCTDAKVWHDIIQNQKNKYLESVSLGFKIQDAMQNYLLTVAEEEDATKILVRYEDGEVKLIITGDLLDLEQISDFCDVFNLKILMTNRCVVENFLTDETVIRYKYLLQ